MKALNRFQLFTGIGIPVFIAIALVVAVNSGVSIAPADEQPAGPTAMPRDCLPEPVVHTPQAAAVPSIAGSPCAPLVALAAQKQVLLYNTDSLELVSVLPFPEGLPQIVRFSSDGRLVIAGGGVDAKFGHVVIWDVVTGKRVMQVGDEFDTVLAADISPAQSVVALGGPSRLVKIFSVTTGKSICVMKKHTDCVTALSFTPDGKELISGDRAGSLVVWDDQGHELQSMSAHGAALTGIACRGALVATSSEDGTVKFWDTMEGKETKCWRAHNGGVRSIAITRDGQILTCGRDRLVRLWDENGRQTMEMGPLNGIATQACYAGGKIIAADGIGLVRAWTLDGKRAGDLDSNPPTIEQRIANAEAGRAREAQIEEQQQKAIKHCAIQLADSRQKAAAALMELNGTRLQLASLRSRADAIQKQWLFANAAVQSTQEALQKLDSQARGAVRATGGNPALSPIVIATLALEIKDAASLQMQEATTGRLANALASYRDQEAILGRLMDGQGRKVAQTASILKMSQIGLAMAQANSAKTAARVKAADLDLARWRDVQARLSASAR